MLTWKHNGTLTNPRNAFKSVAIQNIPEDAYMIVVPSDGSDERLICQLGFFDRRSLKLLEYYNISDEHLDCQFPFDSLGNPPKEEKRFVKMVSCDELYGVEILDEMQEVRRVFIKFFNSSSIKN
jgi:hypothetical protein